MTHHHIDNVERFNSAPNTDALSALQREAIQLLASVDRAGLNSHRDSTRGTEQRGSANGAERGGANNAERGGANGVGHGDWGGGQRRGNARSDSQTLTMTNPYDISSIERSIRENPVGTCGPTPDCETARRFRPEQNPTSRGGLEWQRRSQEQRQRDVEVGQDGRYEVKPGDSLWTLGERLARRSNGQRPPAREIQENIRRITEANPELKCNPNYLRSGRRIVIPDTIKSDRIRVPQQGSADDSRSAPRATPEAPSTTEDARRTKPGSVRRTNEAPLL